MIHIDVSFTSFLPYKNDLTSGVFASASSPAPMLQLACIKLLFVVMHNHQCYILTLNNHRAKDITGGQYVQSSLQYHSLILGDLCEGSVPTP